MKILYERDFLKDVKSIKDKRVKQRLDNLIDNFKVATEIQQISSVKKMAGYRNAYRMRIGDYRLGFFME